MPGVIKELLLTGVAISWGGRKENAWGLPWYKDSHLIAVSFASRAALFRIQMLKF